MILMKCSKAHHSNLLLLAGNLTWGSSPTSLVSHLYSQSTVLIFSEGPEALMHSWTNPRCKRDVVGAKNLNLHAKTSLCTSWGFRLFLAV